MDRKMRWYQDCKNQQYERLFDIEVMKILEYVRHEKEIIDRKKEYRQRPDRQQIDYDRSTIKIQCGCGGRFT